MKFLYSYILIKYIYIWTYMDVLFIIYLKIIDFFIFIIMNGIIKNMYTQVKIK